MQVNLGAPGANGKQRFIARELGLFFDGRIDLRLKYLECLRGHGKGGRAYECENNFLASLLAIPL